MKKSATDIAQYTVNATAEIIDGVGHGLPLQKPAWLAQRLRGWINPTS